MSELPVLQPFATFSNFYAIEPGSYRDGLSFLKGGTKHFIWLDTEENQLQAYNTCAPLKSIISKRGKYFNVGKVEVFKKGKDEPATGTEADKLRAIIANPNPLQTGKQFEAQQNAYIDLFGWCAVLLIKPYGVNSVSAMWNLPPWLLTPKYTTEKFWIIGSRDDLYSTFELGWKNEKIPFDKDAIKIIFDDGFGTQNNIDLTIPDSRLKGHEYDISNIIAAQKAENTGIVDAGPRGILSNKASDTTGHIPMQIGEKEAVQKDFKRYGVTGQEYQVIITEANLSWQQMGSSLKDMNLSEVVKNAIRSLCDAYGWPPELMAGTDADINYQNKEHAKKDAYTGTIIPESESRWQQRTDQLVDISSGLEIRSDFSHVPILQEDKLLTAQVEESKAKTAEKLFRNNFTTFNQCLLALGQEEIEDSIGKLRYFELLALGWTFGNTTLGGGDTMAVNGNVREQG